MISMADDEIHYAETVDDDEMDYDDEYEDDEEPSPLNFVKNSDALMAIGPVSRFVDWIDDDKTEPDAYLAMLLSFLFMVAIIIGIISTFVDF